MWLLANWRLIGILGILAAVGGYILTLTVQRNNAREKAENIQAAFDQYQAKVRVEGEAAKLRVAQTIAADKFNKERADAENKLRTDSLLADIRRLRNANPARSSLPTAPASSSRPDLACFDRSEYQRADGIAAQQLFAGARELADEGTAATIGLDTAKEWAQKVK